MDAIPEAAQAAAFRALVAHLSRPDVAAAAPNIDLMGMSGFCRNCLWKWLEAGHAGVGKEAAQLAVYGRPYAEWKATQAKATAVQLERYAAAKPLHAVHSAGAPPALAAPAPVPVSAPAAVAARAPASLHSSVCCPPPPGSAPAASAPAAPDTDTDTASLGDPYPMISVDAALGLVLDAACALPARAAERVPLGAARGRTAAAAVAAVAPHPPFPASVMDGYAARSADGAGPRTLVAARQAGANPGPAAVGPGECVYVTTGAVLPAGADCVVPVEKCGPVVEAAPADAAAAAAAAAAPASLYRVAAAEARVRVPAAAAGANVRPVGYDMRAGAAVVAAGEVVTPAAVGLLATCGVTEVGVAARVRVGVLSTGDELAPDASAVLEPGQIHDANRPALLALFAGAGAVAVDLGAVPDDAAAVADAIDDALDASAGLDVVVVSGGASVGAADYVKPHLAAVADVRFGRMRMKPGKPTSFAVHRRHGGEGECLAFSLPGNPVSCLVCAELLVLPAVRALLGAPRSQCLPPEVRAVLAEPQALDGERPAYNRAAVALEGAAGALVAHSTGPQPSSRLLSMRGANALLCLPRGAGALPAGTAVRALLLGGGGGGLGLGAPRRGADSHHPTAAAAPPPRLRVCVVTASDRAHAGTYADLSGPAVAEALEAALPGGAEVVSVCVVPDERGAVAAAVTRACDGLRADAVFTTGGTGFSGRDVTPEAVAPLLAREAPGIVHALLAAGLAGEAGVLACASRPVAGVRGTSVVVTLPGAPAAVAEGVRAVAGLVRHVRGILG